MQTQLRVFGPNKRIGTEIGLCPTLYDSLTKNLVAKWYCAQFYLGSHTSYERASLSSEDITASLSYCVQNSISLYVHSTLSSNLADESYNGFRSLEALKHELFQIYQLPAAVIVHIGKNGSLTSVARKINSLQLSSGFYPHVPKRLILEGAAGQKGELGWNWDEIRRLFESLDRSTVGLCIDTQHSFASGMCDYTSPSSIATLFDKAEEIIGAIQVFHLNDSKKLFGSRVDRHESIRKGYIWKDNDSGLKALLERCFDSSHPIDLILETPGAHDDLQAIYEAYF